MSADKHVLALLLVPPPGDESFTKTWRPQGNGRPPLVWKGPMGWNTGPPYLQHSALPLWWNDELVGLGWDIVRRWLLESAALERQRSDHDLEAILHRAWPSYRECRLVAEQMENHGLLSRFIELYHHEVDGLVEV
jgi:hypothetical protein